MTFSIENARDSEAICAPRSLKTNPPQPEFGRGGISSTSCRRVGTPCGSIETLLREVNLAVDVRPRREGMAGGAAVRQIRMPLVVRRIAVAPVAEVFWWLRVPGNILWPVAAGEVPVAVGRRTGSRLMIVGRMDAVHLSDFTKDDVRHARRRAINMHRIAV